VDRLFAAGHDVAVLDEAYSDTMGHAGAVVLHANGTLEGGHDPRADGGAAGGGYAAFTRKLSVITLHATFAPQSVLSCARMNALLRILSVSLLFLAAGSLAQAHPHVWVTMQTELVYAPDGSITGIRHAWSFDDMFSTFATQGLESKEKGKFTREELEPLAKVNVESLKEFGYFTF